MTAPVYLTDAQYIALTGSAPRPDRLQRDGRFLAFHASMDAELCILVIEEQRAKTAPGHRSRQHAAACVQAVCLALTVQALRVSGVEVPPPFCTSRTFTWDDLPRLIADAS
jgi:hypothetical protein